LKILRNLISKYIFGPEKNRAKIYKKVKNKALKKGIFLSSTSPLYKDIAKGNITGLTVPAFNIRTLTFDTASAIFKVAKKTKSSAFILEIAKSEMKYTNQTPEEFALCVLAAAVKEKYKGQVFLQGDHFCLKDTSESSVKDLENLILKSIEIGFYNIDIDCSSLAFEDNIKQTSNLLQFIKNNQPQGIEMAVGGEVNSIGGANTTPEQLENFLKNVQGLSKVACQTGTKHGGNVLPSGEIAQTNIDFENIKKLNLITKQYGLPGIVQHGASTLEQSQFEELNKAGVLEVHLSTLFSDIVFDSKYFPKELKEKMYAYTEQTFNIEQKGASSYLQFIERFRKKSLGIFKKQIWQIPEKDIKKIKLELEEKFEFFFKVFGVNNTKDLVDKIYT